MPLYFCERDTSFKKGWGPMHQSDKHNLYVCCRIVQFKSLKQANRSSKPAESFQV